MKIEKRKYYSSKGWLVCNEACASNKFHYLKAKQNLDVEMYNERIILMEAKSAVGIFSTFGVQETRDLYWKLLDKGTVCILIVLVHQLYSF